MKIENIKETLYLTNTETPASNSDIKSKRMFGAEFNEDDGIQVEKQEPQTAGTSKTYTKKLKTKPATM